MRCDNCVCAPVIDVRAGVHDEDDVDDEYRGLSSAGGGEGEGTARSTERPNLARPGPEDEARRKGGGDAALLERRSGGGEEAVETASG